jgi:hypothetical protein
MAKQIMLREPTTGIEERAFVGFSWTSFFFNFFVPLIRKDFKVAAIACAIYVITLVFSMSAIGFLIWLSYFVFFAMWYNEYHRNNLLAQGYQPIKQQGNSPDIDKTFSEILMSWKKHIVKQRANGRDFKEYTVLEK